MKLRIGLIVLAAVASLSAQQPAQTLLDSTREAIANGKAITKAVTLQYPNGVDGRVLDDIGLIVKRSGAVWVITGTPERVATAEAILKQLDVPPTPFVRTPPPPRKSIQLTAYLIIASRNEVPGSPLPKDLESPVHQVASVFPYKSFSLLDSIELRLLNGTNGAEVKGILPQGQAYPQGGTYDLSVNRTELVEETPANLIRIGKLGIIVNNVRVETDVDMTENQKVVVGKANIDGSANALIVILTAKVVE
jgi:hypothetical protein